MTLEGPLMHSIRGVSWTSGYRSVILQICRLAERSVGRAWTRSGQSMIHVLRSLAAPGLPAVLSSLISTVKSERPAAC